MEAGSPARAVPERQHQMGSQILGRSFFILETLAREFGGHSVTELSREVDMNVSTVHRILNSLMDRGYVRQDEEKRYSISVKFVELSSSYLNGLDLKKEAEPFLQNLSSRLNLTAFLATRMDDQVVYIDRYAVFDGLRRYATIGERRQLYCTSLGKSLLLGFSDKELREYAATVEYKGPTARSISNGEDLIDEIKHSANRGWTEDNEELVLGVSCMAAPIFDYRGHIIAAISVSGPKENIMGENKKDVVETLAGTASGISKCLGYDSAVGEQ